MRQLPALQEKFYRLIERLQAGIAGQLPFIGRRLKHLSDDLNLTATIDSNIQASVVNFLNFISASILTIFYLIFIIHEKKMLPKRLETIYGKERAKNIREVGRRINDSIVEYLYVKFLASLMTAVLAIGVMLAFGLKLPLLWGSILFFANFIPYIGSIAAFMLPIGFGFLQFTSPWTVALMAVIFTVIDMFVGNLWEPRYAGYKLNLSPLAIMLALAFWGWLWGMVGVILSVPILVSIKFVLENIAITRNFAILISHE
jgi:AI-2 transport protein TqsA